MSKAVIAFVNYCITHIYKSAVICTVAKPQMLSAITTLKCRLADIIEPDFGLLDELLRLEVLSRREYAKVRHGDKTVYERNDALLDLLTTEEQCSKFLKALQRTHQEHVVNYVTQNGGQKQYLSVSCST